MAATDAQAMAQVTGWQNIVHTKFAQTQAAGAPAGVTIEQLRAIMPNLSAAKAAQYLPLLNAAMAEAHIDTPLRKAAFLAQVAEESGEFLYMQEIADGWAYDKSRNPKKAKDLGNTQPGDGPRFKGRGPIQLTGRGNYTRAGHDLNLDLVNHPEIAATPEAGFRTTAWYWTHSPRGDLNLLADKGDFENVTRGVNGGTNHLAERVKYYNRAKGVLGVG